MATEEIVTEADKAKGRVIEERKELVEKYTKLFSFVYSDKLHTLNKEMQELLTHQLCLMQEYIQVLTRRLEVW